MVKAKHNKKTKHKKEPHVKKPGKQGDISRSRSQLDAIGLKIVQVNADGNCIFRSLADQLEGNEEEHGKYRNVVVQYILNNRDMFEPFIEDEVPFEDYCKSMGEDGTWAGHMELQAASLVTRCNICIHWLMSPRLYIRNFDDSKARMIHLSYHDGEHYNSVRLKEDSCTGPARPIIIKADAEITSDENLNEELESHSPEAEETMDDNGISRPFQKVISRNKPCVCGSKKKYKACCGTVTARSLAKSAINQTIDHGKTRKEKKQATKGGYIPPINPSPDVGALCI